MAKKKLIETTGQEPITRPTMLEQVWGYNDLSRYGTKDVSVYREQLTEMNRSDLESHARRLNIPVVETTDRLKKNLIQAFESYVAALDKPAPMITKIAPSAKMAKEAEKILSEGR